MNLSQVLLSLFWWGKPFPAKAGILPSVLSVIDDDAHASPLPALWPLFPAYLITARLCIWSVYCLLLWELRMTFIAAGTRRLRIIRLARKSWGCLALSPVRVRCYPVRWSVLVLRAWGGTAVTVWSILYSERKQQDALHTVLLKI